MYQISSFSKLVPWSAVALVTLIAAGCGGGDNGRAPILGADVLPVQAPFITATSPPSAATDVPVSASVSAAFSKVMDPATLTVSTFTVRQGNTIIPGVVTYSGRTAVFTPSAPLTPSTVYTANVNAGARDPIMFSLVGGPVPNPWDFTTAALTPGVVPPPVVVPSPGVVPLPGVVPPPVIVPPPVVAPLGPQAVNLTCAANFAVLAGSTVTNTGPTQIVNGDVGLSPGSAVTGFPPGTVVGGSIRINDVAANDAKGCLTVAYNDAAGRTTAPILISGNLGGRTLAPGLYKSSSTLEVSSGDLVLDGPADAVWIFQIASSLTTSPARQVTLTGGALARNVFWQIGTSATLGTDSLFQGTLMADQSITLNTGAVLNGRALTRIAAVSLDSNTVTKPAP